MKMNTTIEAFVTAMTSAKVWFMIVPLIGPMPGMST